MFTNSLLILIFLFVVGYGIYQYEKWINNIDGYDFDAYKKKYPELVKEGKIICMKCGGSNITLIRERERSLITDAVMVHICRTCGCRLYYSKD